jgi:hypothetical protein
VQYASVPPGSSLPQTLTVKDQSMLSRKSHATHTQDTHARSDTSALSALSAHSLLSLPHEC